MNAIPRSTWIAAGLFGLLGISTIVAGLQVGASMKGVTLAVGVAVLLCAVGLFLLRSAALLVGGVLAVVMLANHGPRVLGGAVPTVDIIATIAALLTLMTAAALLGGQSARSGGC